MTDSAGPGPETELVSETEISPVNSFPAVVATLAVPGLGHFLLGRRGRAIVFFGLVMLAIVVGVLLQGKLYAPVSGRPLTMLATIGAMGMGSPYLLLRAVGYVGDIRAIGFEYGTAFLLSAGLMNLLLVLDIVDIASGRKE